MKTKPIFRSALILLAFVGIGIKQATASSPPSMMGVSFRVFYQELGPYGDWVMDPQFGYVWVPYVDHGFQPYMTNGYWAMTEFGNTWVSNYPWGWAPFHYGRWFWNDFYGWAWVPGYEWGPAWVSWRTGGGYYGWAPLTPGWGINVSLLAPSAHWVFVPQKRFRHRHFHRFCVAPYQVGRIYQRTTVINNTYVYNNQTFYSGPSRREVERVTNSRVPVYQVREQSRPGRTVVQNNSIDLYRPDVRSVRNANENERPQRSYSVEEYRDKRQANGRSAAPSDNFGGREATQPRQNPSSTTPPQGQTRQTPNQTQGRERSVAPATQSPIPQAAEKRQNPTPRAGTSAPQRETSTRQEPSQRPAQPMTPPQTTPVKTRDREQRSQPNVQNPAPRQQPQGNTGRQPTRVEQKKSDSPAPTANPSPQRKTQAAPSTEVQKENPATRTASETRNNRRGTN